MFFFRNIGFKYADFHYTSSQNMGLKERGLKDIGFKYRHKSLPLYIYRLEIYVSNQGLGNSLQPLTPPATKPKEGK